MLNNTIDARIADHIALADRKVTRAEDYLAGKRVNDYGMALDDGDFAAMLENAEVELIQAFSWMHERVHAAQRDAAAAAVRDRLYAVRAAR